MSTPATTYEVQARIVHPGVSEIQAKQERISFDSSPQMGDELPGPAELLCSAFAACLRKNVERFSEMLPSSSKAPRSMSAPSASRSRRASP